MERTIPRSLNQPGRKWSTTWNLSYQAAKAENYPAVHEVYFRVRQILGRLETKLRKYRSRPPYHFLSEILSKLNWVECYWDACNHFARRRSNYTFTGLRGIVPKALESVSPSLVDKYWARFIYLFSSRNKSKPSSPRDMWQSNANKGKRPAAGPRPVSYNK